MTSESRLKGVVLTANSRRESDLRRVALADKNLTAQELCRGFLIEQVFKPFAALIGALLWVRSADG